MSDKEKMTDKVLTVSGILPGTAKKIMSSPVIFSCPLPSYPYIKQSSFSSSCFIDLISIASVQNKGQIRIVYSRICIRNIAGKHFDYLKGVKFSESNILRLHNFLQKFRNARSNSNVPIREILF